MTDLKKLKEQANELRKAKSFKEALPLYKELWTNNGDKFDGAGLLQCLRKLELLEDAIPLAKELITQFPNFNWIRMEVIWTYISGALQKLDENDPLEKVLRIASEIMEFNPNGLAKKLVVFKVMKSAKSFDKWELVNEWAIKINPDTLSREPMTTAAGKEGWSDQALWYNYRLNALFNLGEFHDLITLVDEIRENFPKFNKFFLRLKAKAHLELDNLIDAEKIYHELCSGFKPEWWLLHEYAIVVRELGRKDEALKLMYQAAIKVHRLDPLVSLFVDIGNLCKELGKIEEARNHLVLCKLVREEKNWSIHKSLIDNINELDEVIGTENTPHSVKEALGVCKDYWRNLLGINHIERKKPTKKRRIRRDLSGKISLLENDNRPYCFIFTEKGESIFCSKSDLPLNIRNQDRVTFDAKPSFDKKKKKESWQAINVKISY